MSVVVAKVYSDKIVVASDSIVVAGWSKIPNVNNKFVKMQKINGIIVGSVGTAEESSLMFHYMKTHTIEDMDEKSVLDYVIEFRKWKNDLIGDGDLDNHYMLAYKGKCYAIENMFVFPVTDYYAIGAGCDYAHGAMYMGASPREAVKAACDLCAMVCEPILEESIAITREG